VQKGRNFRWKQVIVASRSLNPAHYPDIEIVSEGLEARVRELRTTRMDFWLFGGGELFSQLLAWNLVDAAEPTVLLILPGGGVQLFPSSGICRQLTLTGHRAYPGGMIPLEYEVRK